MENSFYQSLIREARRQGIRRYVVGAVIARRSSVLLLERPLGGWWGEFWELPSGKVETGESLEDAVRREVQEETGLAVRGVAGYLGFFDYTVGGRKTRQFNFVVMVRSPAGIRVQEHTGYRWLSRRDLGRVKITRQVRAVVESFWKKMQWKA